MNYLILSLKRSGHHALSNWIKEHTNQPFYNNCCFGWKDKKLLTMVGQKEATEGICNIEDFNPKYWEKYDFPSFPFVQNAKVIVVMRSIKNWLASCYQRKFQGNEEHKDVYKNLTIEYKNDSGMKNPPRIDLYCQHVEMARWSGFMEVCFDDWFSSLDYRKLLAYNLGFEFNADADYSKLMVANYGRGSSFEGMKYDLAADKMKVLSRASVFEETKDKEFDSLLNCYAKPRIIKTLNKLGLNNAKQV